MITKQSECEDVDHEKDFSKPCTNFDVDTICQCPDQNDNFDYPNCHPVTDGKCEFNNESGQWVRLVASCTIPGSEDTVCDKTETCFKNIAECRPGQPKTNCCEQTDAESLSTGDDCNQVVKKCYDKNGEQVFGEIPCPDCKKNICPDDPCNKDQLKRCAAALGGELYCDGRIPACMTGAGETQKRFCQLGDEVCKYEIDCKCDAYKCSDNSISIEGVDERFLDALKFRTNDLHETYGPDLNFFIGGGNKTAHTTEGCFHHYRSKSSAARNGIDLVYSFDDLENKCGIKIPDNNQVNVTVWVDDARHTSSHIASATPFAHVSYSRYCG